MSCATADHVVAELRDRIKRRGWSWVAARSGFDRTNLHRAFSEAGAKRGQSLGMIAGVADVLGLELRIAPKSAAVRFRKRPIEVEAWQFTGQDRWDWPDWLKRHPTAVFRCDDHGNTAQIDIPTLEGTMTASRGDWIIRGVRGELYPCKPDIFRETYEAANG